MPDEVKDRFKALKVLYVSQSLLISFPFPNLRELLGPLVEPLTINLFAKIMTIRVGSANAD